MADEKKPKSAAKSYAGVIVVALLFAIGLAIFGEKDDADHNTPTPAEFEQAKASLAQNLKDPKKAKLLACTGVKVYENPQPPGFPPSAEECARLEREFKIPRGLLSGSPASTSGEAQVEPNPDPYAAGQRTLSASIYERSKADLLDQVRTAQFAYRCRVIQMVEANMIYLDGARRISDEDLNSGRSDFHPDLLPAAKAAATEADAKAKQPGACEYWMQHPDAVTEIRQLAQLAISR